MAITDTRFGAITIDRETYEHAAAYLEAKGCVATAQPTSITIPAFNAAKKGAIGLFHVSC